MRPKSRMPAVSTRRSLIERDGYHCRYCGIPLIETHVRKRIQNAYPKVLRWGPRNMDKHFAFQAMALTFDHLIPHSRGGDNSMENMVVCCDPCNCGKVHFMLEEVGLENPLGFPACQSSWNGLRNFATSKS